MIVRSIVLACTLAMAGCTVVTTAADEVAVLVDRPMFFGDGGVRDDDVREGGTRTYTWFSTTAQNMTIKPQAFS